MQNHKLQLFNNKKEFRTFAFRFYKALDSIDSDNREDYEKEIEKIKMEEKRLEN